MASQVIWTVDSASTLAIYDIPTGLCLKSFKPLSTSSSFTPKDALTLNETEVLSHLRKTKASGVGIVGNWLSILPNEKNVVYFYHHLYLSGKGNKGIQNFATGGIKSKGETSASFKVICGERWSAFSISPDEKLFIASSSTSGKVMIWRISTGTLMNVFQPHYQIITHLKLTADSKILLSVTNDGIIKAWFLPDLLVVGRETTEPLYTLSNIHSKSITDVYIGHGDWNESIFLTVSFDQSCKMFESCSGNLLATFLYPSPLTCVTMDSLEKSIFTGSVQGELFIFSINDLHVSSHNSQTQTAIFNVSMNQGDVSSDSVLKGHESYITALVLSLDNSLLFSSDLGGNTFIWDVSSRLKIKAIHTGSKEPVVYLRASLLPPYLIQPLPDSSTSIRPPLIAPFQRVIAPLESQSTLTLYPRGIEMIDDDLFDDNIQPKTSEETEVLKKTIARLNRTNSSLYHTLVNKTLKNM